METSQWNPFLPLIYTNKRERKNKYVLFHAAFQDM
jgi:hypothetical protein